MVDYISLQDAFLILKCSFQSRNIYELGFPTRRDSATFRDKGTEISSLSRDKGTTGQAQNLATGRDRPGQPVKFYDGTGRGMGQILTGNQTMDVFSSQHHKQFIHFVIELSHLLARQKSWRKFQADISHDRPDTWQGF